MWLWYIQGNPQWHWSKRNSWYTRLCWWVELNCKVLLYPFGMLFYFSFSNNIILYHPYSSWSPQLRTYQPSYWYLVCWCLSLCATKWILSLCRRNQTGNFLQYFPVHIKFPWWTVWRSIWGCPRLYPNNTANWPRVCTCEKTTLNLCFYLLPSSRYLDYPFFSSLSLF